MYQPTIPTNTIVYMWDLRYASLTINHKKPNLSARIEIAKALLLTCAGTLNFNLARENPVKKPWGIPPNLAAQTLLQASKKNNIYIYILYIYILYIYMLTPPRAYQNDAKDEKSLFSTLANANLPPITQNWKGTTYRYLKSKQASLEACAIFVSIMSRSDEKNPPP